MIKILNTISGRKEEFAPMEGKKVKMFVCGPTVYDYIHIGNARTFVFFDVVAKYLRHRGYEVDYIQNITDIDNKIIERAGKEGIDSLEYAKKYSEIFKQDMQALGVTSPEYKNATDHIPEVIKQVQILLDKKNAYVIEKDGIYFDLSTFPDYGKLSGRTAGMADDAVSRIDDSDKKRNRGDFALWKFSQDNDPSTEFLGGLKHRQETTPRWPAPFGDGRPGWHIEDTAITEKYFGPQYDLHGGGQDLIFPHHEAEIAQQESASDKKPFVKYWMHVGFLVNQGDKMSKSKGNFQLLHSLLTQYSKEVIRNYLLTSAHYRTPLRFTSESLNNSESNLFYLRELLAKLKSVKTSTGIKGFDNTLKEYERKFFEGLEDDFNIPEALAPIISKLCPYLNTNLEEISLSQKEAAINLFEKINNFLGIMPQDTLSKEIEEEKNKINELRIEGKFEEADKMKIDLKSKGFYVSDSDVAGTIVIKDDRLEK